jgi:hypothetical protein
MKRNTTGIEAATVPIVFHPTDYFVMAQRIIDLMVSVNTMCNAAVVAHF